MRLTIKNSDGTHSQPSDCTFANIFWKLAEFEDFMEEQGFDSLEELKINTEYLKDKIKTDKFNYEQLHKFKNHLQEENKSLKARWEKLKEYVNTPKEFQEWREEMEITVDSIKAKMQELEE